MSPPNIVYRTNVPGVHKYYCHCYLTPLSMSASLNLYCHNLTLSFSQAQSWLTTPTIGRHNKIESGLERPSHNIRQIHHFNIENTIFLTTWKSSTKRKITDFRLTSLKHRKHRLFFFKNTDLNSQIILSDAHKKIPRKPRSLFSHFTAKN